MPFRHIETLNISDAAADQIKDLIVKDVLRPGDRLPSERELGERMGISRNALREALKRLESEGLLYSKRGAGLFVAEAVGVSLAEPLVKLLEAVPEAFDDYLKFRLMIEPPIAGIAARQATDLDIANMGAIIEKMEDAHQTQDFEREVELDVEFHMAIIEASHNVVTIQLMRSLFDLVKYGIVSSRDMMFENEGVRGHLQDQHSAIMSAITSRNKQAAIKAMQVHLTYVNDQISSLSEVASLNETALKRAEWLQEVEGKI